jgi:AbrB family looped-hinge helix DNA binding protein
MSGLAEPSVPFAGAAPAPVRLKVGADGRVLIPAELRKAAGIAPGSTVDAEVVDGELRLIPFAEKLRRVQALLAPLKRPGVDEIEEFLAERRSMWGED